MSIVGSFLLANAILFRHPRSLVAELFEGAQRQLRPVREYIFHRVQVTLGFLFLLSGFGVQLFGRYQPAPLGDEVGFPTTWVGLTLVAAVGLELFGWWLSHSLFRRYVREYLVRHTVDLSADMKLAREVGELVGLETTGDETVQSYVARLRQRLGLDRIARGPVREGRGTRKEARRQTAGIVLESEVEEELV